MPRIPLMCLAFLLLGFVAPSASAAGIGETELSVNVQTPAFDYTPSGVSVPGYVLNDAPGAPQLPVYGVVFELPAEGRWELDFASRDSKLLPQRVPVSAVPTPVLERLPQAGDAEAVDTAAVRVIDQPDPAIYLQDAFYPASPVVAGAEQWQNGKRLLAVRVFPFQYNPVTNELLHHPDLTAIVRILPGQTAAAAVIPEAETATLALAGELGALRIRTSQRGMHRLTYSDLSGKVPLEMVSPASFAMTYLGQPVQIRVIGGDDGSFDVGDLVVFYAEPYVGRWMPSNVYRFSYGSAPAEPATRMTSRAATPTGSEPLIQVVTQTLTINLDKAYQSDYWIDTEADHFFDNLLKADATTPAATRSYTLVLDDAVTSAGEVSVQGLIYGVNDVLGLTPDHFAKLRLNAYDLGAYQWDGRKPYTITLTTAPASYLDQTTNMLNLVADFDPLPESVTELKINPDAFQFSYPATADAEGDRIDIVGLDTGDTSIRLQVTGFSSAAVTAYDVRNPSQPVQLLTTSAENMGGSYRVNVWDTWPTGASAPAYWLSTNAALLAPAAIEVDQPTHWKSPEHEADYIAIMHSSLSDAIQPLLDHRASQGFRIAKVNVQDIYDEFNYGHLHQDAIRAFLMYAYNHWNQGGPRPKYVLLVGDGITDYKNTGVTTLKNLVPSFLTNIDPWLVETAADSRFVSVDGPEDYMPEMSVGRISAQNATGVTDYVAKALAYENQAQAPDGDWQSRIVFAADAKNDGAGNFHKFSDDILATIPSAYVPTKIYWASSTSLDTEAEMKAAIRQAFDNSAVYLQWFGHASRYRWGGTAGSMWNTIEVPNLAANTRIPFVAAFSCWDGYFVSIDQNRQTLAEVELFQAGKAALGNLSPSGLHVGSALSILDRGLTKSFFTDRMAVIGDAVNAAKLYYFTNSSATYHDVIDTSILFGDPAIRLRLPAAPAGSPEMIWAAIEPYSSVAVRLLWDHMIENETYRVHRSTLPYFQPGAADSNIINEVSASGYGGGATIDMLDDGHDRFSGDGLTPDVQVVGDVANNYFWAIEGWAGGGSGFLNWVGEFDYALVKGN